MQIKPGTIQSLPVHEVGEKNILLGDDQDGVLINRRELKPGIAVGEMVEVFTFYNEERELEATTRLPNLQVDEVGCFRVANSNDLGSFISIGTRRDILIPKKEQVESLEEGRMVLVILCHDPESKRIYASTKLNRHLRNNDIPYQRGDEVVIMIAEKIEIGRRVVVDGKYVGALFRQEMTDKVRLGEKVKGFIRKVEGKDIVVSMQREGMELLEDSKEKIMQYLDLNGGYVRLTDDTDPEEIKLRLHMSKKAFKKAAGMLFKEGKILLTKFGIKINKTGEVPQQWEKNKIFVEEDSGDEKPKPRERKSLEERSPKKDATPSSEKGEERPAKREYTPREKPVRSDSEKPRRRDEESDDRRDDERPAPREPRRDGPPKKELTFKGKKH